MKNTRSTGYLLMIFLIIFASNVERNAVEGIGPLAPAVAVGTAAITSFLLTSYDSIKCQFVECCTNSWIDANITGLSRSLNTRLHGQHLVIGATLKAVKAHVNNPDPKKALTLSFHGWTGGGKNYVSRMIADHLYVKGMQSRYVHLFISTLHFPHKSELETYKDQLRGWIKGNVSICPQQLFIFDEVDKMHESLIDTISSYLDYHKEINGVNYRKSIFLFLSNTAGNDISNAAFSHWQDGGKREDISFKKMEEIITLNSYNEKGGLWHSSLISKNLINAFIPFLPLERIHVKMCIKDDLLSKGHRHPSEELISSIADEMHYFPKEVKLYSTSGCKRVTEKVDYVMEEV
ncbi:torsin-1A-like [Tubulanus polymorphus]|uniref:torsin-1A-like n=1 Tax=Tubulanus polymorphus TaxID=672921 RepID=UPI003DA6A1FB